MNTQPALRIALPIPLRQLFDYTPPPDSTLKHPKPGTRIQVPFHNRQIIGILIDVVDPTATFTPDKLKPATKILDTDNLFTPDIWQLCHWAADYYHYPIGEVLNSALPALLRKGKPIVLKQELYWHISTQGQQLDLATIKRAKRQVELLKFLAKHSEGITTKTLQQHGYPKNLLTTAEKKGWVIAEGKFFSINHTTFDKPLEANPTQQEAITAIHAAHKKFQVFLLDGVTGSGKTEVYLQAIQQYLNHRQQILVLVPEIGLTPQTINRFRNRFSVPIAALHSGMSEKERLNVWIAAKSNQAQIIIGTRSALFTPFANLGLIIVDEEHDLSFKQQDTFRYHARDLAVMRAHFLKIPIVLGSATPSLESLHNVHTQRYQHLRLPARAGYAQLPTVRILDICKAPLEQGLSQPLLTEIANTLTQGDQVMLFLNRRGFAPVLMCHACGWMAKCTRCDTRMTYYQHSKRLHCHHCDAKHTVTLYCKACGANELHPIGLGTERLEEVLSQKFPGIAIARIDRDTTQRKGSMEELLDKIQKNEFRILIGTQMLAKGHHFPNVTLVGIVDADGGFFSNDFRGLERTGQLLLQVAGRAGRAEKPGTVIIQTHHPDHPLLHQLLRENYQQFAQSLLSERANAHLPPYNFFALFRAEAYDPRHVTTFLQHIKNINPGSGNSIRILGPISAPMARRAGYHRAQLLIQSAHRPTLHDFLKNTLPEIEKIPGKHRVHWSLDVDPVDMY